MRLHQFLDNPHRFKRVLKPLIPEELRRWTKLQIQKRNRVRNPVSPETRRELIAVFRKDILQLQELIDRDLSHWLEAR